jgi:hypothetical protein
VSTSTSYKPHSKSTHPLNSSKSQFQTCVKKSNRRPHRHTFNKQAENKCLKNVDQHSCRLERAQSFSSFLRLSSSSFCHRWRRQIDPNLSDPRLIDISSGDRFIPFTVVGSNHDKTEKWPEKFIPQQRHHLRHNVDIWKAKSPR